MRRLNHSISCAPDLTRRRGGAEKHKRFDTEAQRHREMQNAFAPFSADRGAHYYETNRQERDQMALKRKAAALGFKLVPALYYCRGLTGSFPARRGEAKKSKAATFLRMFLCASASPRQKPGSGWRRVTARCPRSTARAPSG